MQKAEEMVPGRNSNDGDGGKSGNKESDGDGDASSGQGRAARERQGKVVGGEWMGCGGGREWWELKGMTKEWKEKKRKRKRSEIEKKRGVTMVLHVMLREAMMGCYEEKFVQTMDAMDDVRLLLGGERGVFGEGRHKLDVYKRRKARDEEGERGCGREEFSSKSKWGVAQAKRIWGFVDDPAADGGVAMARVEAASEMIGMIHKDTRKRDRYASAATALNCSSMDINRVLNWMMGMQRWDVLQHVEKATGLLSASVLLCGECSTRQTEAAAAEKVVSVQRTIQDLRDRFGCLRLARAYVVHKGALLVVVIIGPVAELAELQNCVVPFMLMLNPRATVSAKAPASHLVARELFYSPSHSRRLAWAMANASLLLGQATGEFQSHKAMCAALSGVLSQEPAQGPEWVQHAHDVTRARCAAICLVRVGVGDGVGVMHTMLALCRGNMGCIADNEAVCKLGAAVARTRSEGCGQATSRLGELCSRPAFAKGRGSTTVSMAAAGLICGAIGMLPVGAATEKACIAECVARVIRCPTVIPCPPALRTNHLRLLSRAGALGSWTVGYAKPVHRQFTGLSETRGDKPRMALLRKIQRTAKAIQSRPMGSTIVNKNGTTGLLGDTPLNLLLKGHPAFGIHELQCLVAFFRRAESHGVCEADEEMHLGGEDASTCAEMHRFEYPCTVGNDGRARMLSDVFPATRTGTPMDGLPYPASIINAVYDPMQYLKQRTHPCKPAPPPRVLAHRRQEGRSCSYFSEMWTGVDSRPMN